MKKFKELTYVISNIREWAANSHVLLSLSMSSLFLNITSLMFPIFLLQVYDRVIGNAAYDTLYSLVFMVIIAISFEALLQIVRAQITSWTNAKFEHSAACDAFTHLVDTSISEFEKDEAGTHLERIGTLSRLKDFYGAQALTTFFDLPFFLVYLLLITYIGSFIVIVPLVVLILFCLSASVVGNTIRKTFEKRQTADSRRMNFIIETLKGIHVIKSMAMEPLMVRRYERLQSGSIHWDHQLSISSAHSMAISSFLSQLNMVLIVSFGSIMVINGDLTIGGLAACTLLGNRCLTPISKAMTVWRRLQSIIIAQHEFDKILLLPSEQNSNATRKIKVEGKVELKNVSLTYPKSEEALFNDINLTIYKNETISLVGEGSCGKSSLLHLICGYINPTEGEVLIDDVPLKELDLHDYRKQVAYIPTNGVMYKGTILENITLFREEEYYEKAMKIAHHLSIDEAIYHMPRGFDTVVGNRAVDFLPKGLKQRITIARCLIDEPPIVLFDESNTAIDIQSDFKLQEYLANLKGSCTMILISQRPSIIKIADRHFKLSNGVLTENNSESGNSKRTVA